MAAPKLKSNIKSSKGLSEENQLPMYDTNPFWQSTLFSDVYLRNDVPHKYREIWEQDSSGEFYTFCERFREFCEEIQGEISENWTERTTINRVIKPVLKLLGWSTTQQEPWIEDESLTVKEFGETKTYKPDFLIVDDPKQLKYIERESGEKKTNAARAESIISIEAKYWGRIDESKYTIRDDKDRADKKSQPDSTKSMDFDEQCLKYVDILHHDYGILTDGRTWRLFHKDLSSGSFKRRYQFNLGILIKHVQAGLDKKGSDYITFVDNAKYFYHFFSKSALYNVEGGRRFVDDLIADSNKYSDQVEKDLKLRFVSAMATVCNGFRKTLGKSYSAAKLDQIRSAAESHIFTILFVRFCESRNILPLRQNPEYRMISLSNTIDKLDLFNPEKEVDDLNTPVLKRRFRDQFEYKANGTELHESLLKIVDILQNGLQHPAAKFSIAKFKETVFSDEELEFTKMNKITNREFAKLLFELTYIEIESSGRFQQIAYSFFAPRQLGSIYESFLEFRLDQAEEDLAFIKKKWVPADINSNKIRRLKVPTVQQGRLFFTPDNKDRKETGSYYTPDCVVQFILDKALGKTIKGKSTKQILNLKICDPAMGSGHFLAGALDYLAKKYMQILDEETTHDLDISPIDAKRLVLHNCIYGVDTNPRAVKLAKMSLWLESAASNKPLEPLDDQLKCSNSLVDKNLWFEEWKVAKCGFDAVVGNPPYLGEKGHKEIFQEIAKGWLGERFYLGKMDLFYFFFHLALDILKEEGVVGFITTNYYPTASGAFLLRKDLKERTNIDLLLNLNEIKVFGDASGQHNLITIAKKTNEPSHCVIGTAQSREKVSESILTSFNSTLCREIKQEKLYDGEKFYIRMNSDVAKNGVIDGILQKMNENGTPLGMKPSFRISTGIMGGCDFVTKLNSSYVDVKTLQSRDIQIGDGIFVLDSKTPRDKQIIRSIKDSKYIKPFYKNSDIFHFQTSIKPEKFVIYSAPKNPAIEDQNVHDHLKKFRPILDRIREINKESAKLWCVLRRGTGHSEVFEGPKIVAPQRSKLNVFGYNEQPWYGASDVFFITKSEAAGISLKCCLGLLSSKMYFCWLYFRGKRKGESLELTRKPLSEIPIPDLNIKIQRRLESVVDRLIENNQCDKSLDKLNLIVNQQFLLTEVEAKAIDQFYDSKVSTGGSEDSLKEEDAVA